jgi:signal transduction histidine kinase
VARRWRIRYKLIFGFGLVLGIMALLLLATLRGLLSYYLTMNSIRDKITELRAAEEFKAAIARLIPLAFDPHLLSHRAETAQPASPDGAPRLPPEIAPVGQDGAADNQPQTLTLAFMLARQKLDDYEHQLDEALHHTHEPVYGEHQHALVDVLRASLDELAKATASAHSNGQMMALAPDQKLDAMQRKEIEKHAEPISKTSDDLYKNVHDALHERTNESRSHYQITLWISIPTSVVGLLVVCGLVRSFYRWILYPIRDLGAGVARVARGDFSRRIELDSGDEMEDLAAAFNDMMQRLHDLYSDLARQVNERSRQLVRSERLASVGFLAAGVAHEINNPLASIAFCSEALEARLAELLRSLRPAGQTAEDVDVFTKYLKMIQEEAFRCKSITESLLAFSRTNERRREPTDLRALVQSVLDVTQHLQNHRGKHITFEVNADRVPGGQITAWANAEEIKSVVLNLVTNALESMDEGGHLVIRLRQAGDRAELQFADNGCGMTTEVLENIFEPFFTRSRTGKGTGLGLTISHRIIHQHGGEIEASSSGPGLGSTFIVRLPVQPPPQEDTDAPGNDFRPPAAAPGQAAERAA